MRTARRAHGSPVRRTCTAASGQSRFAIGAGPRTALWAPHRISRRPHPTLTRPKPPRVPTNAFPPFARLVTGHAANALVALVASGIHAYHRPDNISARQGQEPPASGAESSDAATAAPNESPVLIGKSAEGGEPRPKRDDRLNKDGVTMAVCGIAAQLTEFKIHKHTQTKFRNQK